MKKRASETFKACLILITVFCISFVFFYQRSQKQSLKKPLILTSSVINQPLPRADLVNSSGKVLEDKNLRKGKVILVFSLLDCLACDQESEFLKTVVNTREDISFLGVIPFGEKELALERAQSKYPFKTYFDDGSMLSKSLEVYEVPIKVFLEDGIIKKIWLGATVDKQPQAEFIQWLSSL